MSIEFHISKRNAKVKCDGIHTSEPHIDVSQQLVAVLIAISTKDIKVTHKYLHRLKVLKAMVGRIKSTLDAYLNRFLIIGDVFGIGSDNSRNTIFRSVTIRLVMNRLHRFLPFRTGPHHSREARAIARLRVLLFLVVRLLRLSVSHYFLLLVNDTIAYKMSMSACALSFIDARQLTKILPEVWVRVLHGAVVRNCCTAFCATMKRGRVRVVIFYVLVCFILFWSCTVLLLLANSFGVL